MPQFYFHDLHIFYDDYVSYLMLSHRIDIDSCLSPMCPLGSEVLSSITEQGNCPNPGFQASRYLLMN